MKILVASFFTAFIVLNAFNSKAQSAIINVDEFSKSILSPDAQLLDVRTAGEYQSGHLANALQADWNNQQQFADRAKTLDKNKPVYTYCLSGVRSKAAAEWLTANGYKAFTLSGGINAWKNAGKPVEGKKDVPQISSKDYFAKIPANKTVLVDFSAVWCPPCKKMALVLDSLKQTDSKRFVLVTIDGGEQTSISKEMKVENFPTLILYKNGKEAWRKTGLVTLQELRLLL